MKKQHRKSKRRLQFEMLSQRACLAGDLFAGGLGHNDAFPTDVNQDGSVSPLDALLVINALNQAFRGTAGGEGEASESTTMLDVDGDSALTPMDALLVINSLIDNATDTSTDSSASQDSSSTTDSETDTSTDLSTDTSSDSTTDDSSTATDDSGSTTDDSSTTTDDSDSTTDDSDAAGCVNSSGSTTTSTSTSNSTTTTLNRPTLEEVFAAKDTNADGFLSESEVGAEKWEHLSALDADSSGGISLEELLNGKPGIPDGHGDHGFHDGHGGHHHGPSERPTPQSLITKFDTNDDALLGSDEVPADLWKIISAADTDTDGFVSLAELTAFKPTPRSKSALPSTASHDEFFARLDGNSDGSLTSNELPAALWDKISQADADEDGAVTAEELASADPPILLPPGHRGMPGGPPMHRGGRGFGRGR